MTYRFISSRHAGTSTIELMIALAVLATSISAAAVVAYGNQSLTLDATVYQQGLYEVSGAMESGRAELTKDINATLTPPVGITYSTNHASDCAVELKASKNWTIGTRNLSIEQATKIVSPLAIQESGGTCTITPPTSNDGWACPLLGSSTNITPDVEPSAIDVVDAATPSPSRLAYVTSIKKNQEVFLIYDVTNGDNPMVPLAPITPPIIGPNDDTAGFYDLVVVWEPNGSAAYAYVVGRDSAAQVQVIDVLPTSSDYNTVVPGGTLALSGNLENALSVAYRERLVSGVPKKLLYVGTRNNSAGPEFYAVDVTTPSAPVGIGTPLEIGADVNDIIAAPDNVVYLATSNSSAELIALNAANVSGMIPTNVNLSPNNPALSLSKVGNRLYVGRYDPSANDTDQDFQRFDVTTALDPQLLTGGISTNIDNIEVTDLLVVSDLAFLSTTEPNKEMKVRRGMSNDNVCFFSDSQLSNMGAALDYEGDRVYMLSLGGSRDLQIYKPNPSPCATPPPACP